MMITEEVKIIYLVQKKKKDIKEVLIEAVKLKTKLRNQLDNLKSKVKIEQKVVIEQLLKAGIDIEKKN